MTETSYKYWTRRELYDALIDQVRDYGFNPDDLSDACYDLRWTPSEDYDGCSVIQDPLHPFYPCLVHDYDWIVKGGGNWSDLKFRANLRKFGFSKWKANRYYFFVRMGWLLWYKWKQ